MKNTLDNVKTHWSDNEVKKCFADESQSVSREQCKILVQQTWELKQKQIGQISFCTLPC